MSLTAQSLDGLKWPDAYDRSYFAGNRSDYGVRRDDGRWLSFDGKSPYIPAGGLPTAERVAAELNADDERRLDPTLYWIGLGGVR